MHDYHTGLERLRTGAAECRAISDLATDPRKREIFDRLALHLSTLADQVEQVVLTDKSAIIAEMSDAQAIRHWTDEEENPSRTKAVGETG